MVRDSYNFDKEQVPNSDPRQYKNSDPGICIKVKRGIRIQFSINVKRIRNTVGNQIQIQEKERIKGSVVDPDPDWIRIERGPWIRIQIQEGKNDSQK
jgi:hypothetical protein